MGREGEKENRSVAAASSLYRNGYFNSCTRQGQPRVAASSMEADVAPSSLYSSSCIAELRRFVNSSNTQRATQRKTARKTIRPPLTRTDLSRKTNNGIPAAASSDYIWSRHVIMIYNVKRPRHMSFQHLIKASKSAERRRKACPP